MEIDKIIYKAKDGCIFYDPLECEEYEKRIGIIPGSVGDLLLEMEKQCKPDDYIHGIVKVLDGTESSLYIRTTVCADGLLEDYVNIGNLTQQQRYIIATVSELADTLGKLNKDLPCQYFIIFSADINFKKTGCMANYNQKAWSTDKQK